MVINMSHKFYGGVHPSGFKSLTCNKGIKAFIPKRVVIPLSQHVGAPAQPLVKTGDVVRAGEVIGRASAFISSPVHASISGKVAKIAYCQTPVSARVLAVTIESDEEGRDFEITERKDAVSLPGEEILDIIKESGIVGLGGAAFPTHVKLSPPKGKSIDAVILNCAECEPYLTCDQRLIVENPQEVLKGLGVIVKVLGVNKAYIAIEDNKPEAIRAMESALIRDKGQGSRGKGQGSWAKIVVLKTKYPQGAEKQLIKAVLNRVVPAGGLPMDVGCIVQNVGTAFAVYEAVYLGKPLIERVITITGPCVKEPMNVRVRIGTLLSDLVDFFGGFIKEPKKVIFGGPKMGVAQYTLDVPIIKGSSGVLFFSQEDVRAQKEGPCIRCGKCIEICPMRLAPTSIMNRVKKEDVLESREFGILHCFECGACAYICPAKIPLLDYMKLGKARLDVNKANI